MATLSSASVPGASAAEFYTVADRVRNWGRWGPDDEIGTLNLISPRSTREAMAAVAEGRPYSLSVDFSPDGVWTASGTRRNLLHFMAVDGADFGESLELPAKASAAGHHVRELQSRNILRFHEDYVVMPLQVATQWDALAHVEYDGLLYNGFPASSVSSFGAARAGIDKVDVAGVAGRAVLLDIAASRGVDSLEPHTAIYPEELDEVAAGQGTQIRAGDIVCVRTGWLGEFRRTGDGHYWVTQSPGLSWRCAEWLSANEIGAVASDTPGVETQAPQIEGVALPLHLLCLRDMGMMLGEIWALDMLAEACRRLGKYEFFLTAAPLRIIGAVGSPLNPLAFV